VVPVRCGRGIRWAPSPAGHGQRLVAIELAEQGPAPRASIRALSVPIQEAMQQEGFENVVPDLNRLKDVMATPDGVRASLLRVLGMRPFCTTPTNYLPPAARRRTLLVAGLGYA
jgi:hypothetical protein